MAGDVSRPDLSATLSHWGRRTKNEKLCFEPLKKIVKIEIIIYEMDDLMTYDLIEKQIESFTAAGD